MKIDFDKTIRAAARLRGHLGLTDPETICRALDLQILRIIYARNLIPILFVNAENDRAAVVLV